MKNNQVLAIVVVLLAIFVLLLLTEPGKKNTKKEIQQEEKKEKKVDPEMLTPIFPKEPPVVPNTFLNHIDSSKMISEKVLDLKTIELFNFSEGLGIRAKHDIKKDQLIARTNMQNPTTTMNVLHLTRMCKNLQIPKTEDFQHVLISIQMLYEKLDCDGKTTFFKEYFKDISKRLNFNTLGYFWKDDELNELQGSFLKGMILRQRNGIEKLFQQAKKHSILDCFSKKCGKKLNWDKILTKESFEWAFFITFTRFFSATFSYKEMNFEGKIKLLLPGIDYFNTNLHHTNARQVITEQDFRVFATEDIKKGDQIYLKYWKELKPNELLIVTYGFCDETNPNSLHIFDIGNYFIKKFESIPNGETKSKLHEALKKFNLFGFQFIRLNLDPEFKVLQPEFLQLLRAFQLSINQLESRKNLEFITHEIENKALKEGIEIIKEKLKLYSTTIEQDENLLKNLTNENSNKKCAIIVRKEEKKILQNFIQYLNNKISN